MLALHIIHILRSCLSTQSWHTALVQMSGQFKVDGSGNVELKETDGIDYAPVTVQLPGGERVPFLFSVKELDAKVRKHPPRRVQCGFLRPTAVKIIYSCAPLPRPAPP